MLTKTKLFLTLVAAFLITLASSLMSTTVRLIYPGTEDCQAGCDFVAGGWPLPYLVDSHGISVGGSISLWGGLIGEDIVLPLQMTLDFCFWFAVLGLLARLAGSKIRS